MKNLQKGLRLLPQRNCWCRRREAFFFSYKEEEKKKAFSLQWRKNSPDSNVHGPSRIRNLRLCPPMPALAARASPAMFNRSCSNSCFIPWWCRHLVFAPLNACLHSSQDLARFCRDFFAFKVSRRFRMNRRSWANPTNFSNRHFALSHNEWGRIPRLHWILRQAQQINTNK